MVRTQQAVRQPVEGADPHTALASAHQLPDTMTHLRRRFVGKRHRHNRIRRAVFHAHQPGDTMHQYARLTTARARQHQKVAAWRGYRFALFVIKAVEQVRNVHWHRRVKIGWAEKRNALRQKLGIYTDLLIISARSEMPTGKFPDAAVNGCPRFASDRHFPV